MKVKLPCLFALILFSATALWADTIIVNTGAPNGAIGMASRPDAGGKIEIEAADDFITTADVTHINSAIFTGLITSTGGGLPSIGQLNIEIYRVFPNDSTNPPSGNVNTRVNSPSDVAFATKDSSANELVFSSQALGTFTAANSVLNGINKKPNQLTFGEGPITGEEVTFTVTFTTPFDLPADHYFFVPQVQITGGEFYWLSGQRPLTGAGGTTPFNPDLQTWIRNANLDPDWSRVGADIVGNGAAFNGSFSLRGDEVPEPSSISLLLGGIGVIARKLRKAR
jgi:hypothetical protein